MKKIYIPFKHFKVKVFFFPIQYSLFFMKNASRNKNHLENQTLFYCCGTWIGSWWKNKRHSETLRIRGLFNTNGFRRGYSPKFWAQSANREGDLYPSISTYLVLLAHVGNRVGKKNLEGLWDRDWNSLAGLDSHLRVQFFPVTTSC